MEWNDRQIRASDKRRNDAFIASIHQVLSGGAFHDRASRLGRTGQRRRTASSMKSSPTMRLPS
jgi:hypothetical protein